MNNNNAKPAALALAVALAAGTASQAQAAIDLYDADGTRFSTDGYINTFYVNTDVDQPGEGADRRQSRVKMGFLPNYLGFNVHRDMGDLTLGARSSFWVTINDGETGGTSTGIDVRQFYGTVASDWGEVLIGKDFGLFARSNIFLDEILMGYGQTSDTLGLVNGQGVSFGNIATGYPYPFPTAQITYRSPELAGFKLAVGVMDPNGTAEDGSGVAYEEAPRFESELTYALDLDGINLTAWVNGQYQSSESTDNAVEDVTSTGVGYGAKVSVAGLSLSASGFTAEGVNPLFTNNFLDLVAGEQDTEGYLVQGAYRFGANRVVLSYGENEDDVLDQERDNTTVALFHDVNSNLKLVAEYSMLNVDSQSTGAMVEETDTVAVGAVLTW